MIKKNHSIIVSIPLIKRDRYISSQNITYTTKIAQNSSWKSVVREVIFRYNFHCINIEENIKKIRSLIRLTAAQRKTRLMTKCWFLVSDVNNLFSNKHYNVSCFTTDLCRSEFSKLWNSINKYVRYSNSVNNTSENNFHSKQTKTNRALNLIIVILNILRFTWKSRFFFYFY